VKLPVNVNVKEEPFIENALGKYYLLDLYAYSYEYTDIDLYAGKLISVHGIVYELDNIKIQHRVYFRRFLTINGTQYLFNVWLGFGKILGKQYVSPSTTFENIEVPCTFISFLTEYTGESSIIIFGNEYTSKSYETGVSGQTRDILLVFTEGETIAFQLN